MNDLTEFLLARLAEDEQAAEELAELQRVVVHAVVREGIDAALVTARLDAQRVLAECEAKRRLVQDHGDQHECTSLRAAECPYIGCNVLRLLALPHADHPDYDESWRP